MQPTPIQSIEQGIYVVLMLALQKNHEPIKSYTMSQILDVSDSYLKKILRKLVIAGLINSNASKDGGFTLAKSVRDINPCVPVKYGRFLCKVRYTLSFRVD